MSIDPPVRQSERCSISLPDRICDEPAVGIYHGIGGRQPVCKRHRDSLRRRWGIRVRPLARSDDLTPRGPRA